MAKNSHDDPCSVATLLVATLLVVTVAARPRLPLRGMAAPVAPSFGGSHPRSRTGACRMFP
jgi:hypothetical protein